MRDKTRKLIARIVAISLAALMGIGAAYAIFAVILNKKANAEKNQNPKRIWPMLGLMLVSGACIAINNKFNLYLSGVMDSAVFFPIVNGGGLVLTTLAAVLLFKEKLSRKQWVGIVLGILSVVFLCNPFS